MSSEKLTAYIRLGRPVNVLITFISIPVACWIAGGSAENRILFFLAALTGALVTAGANAINDSFDIEIDRINRPERPLPSGILTKQNARSMWLAVSLPAVIINFFINSQSLFIVLFAVALLYYYSAKLKKTVLAGNIAVALMTGMAFIYGGSVAGHIDKAVVPALFAFLVNLARELIKDVEDIEGDKKTNALTLAVKSGPGTAIVISTAVLAALIAVTILAAVSDLYNRSFLPVVTVADLIIIASIVFLWCDRSPVSLRRASLLLKISMVVGLLSIVAGSI